MPGTKGYRSDRLRRRRRSKVERSQAWLLYVLAAAIAFAAVLGAWYVTDRLSKDEPVAEKSGYLAAIQLTAPGKDAPVAALLVVQDPSGGDPGVYHVPPDLLLEGPNGEYVFAADSMASGQLAGDLGRVVHAPIDAVYSVPASDLGRWAGTDELQVELDDPVSIDVDGHTLVVEDGGSVAVSDLPAVFAVEGGSRRGVTALQAALVKSALEAAALRPAAERRRLAAVSPSPQAGPSLSEIVGRITAGSAVVERFPAGTRVAEGQFAFLPDAGGDPGRHHAPVAGVPRRGDRPGAQRERQGRGGGGGRGTSRQPRREPPGAAQRGQLLLQADADPGRRGHPPGGPGHPCYTRPRRRPGRPWTARGDGAGHRRGRLPGTAIRHKGPAVAALPEPTTSERLARDIVALAAGKKAQDIVVLSMDEAVSYTDYFVIVSGANTRQTRAIADEIQQKLRADRRPARVEGEREGEWILVDFIDVVVHVFTTTARDFYRLETLWGDVPRLDVAGEG